MRGCTPPCQEYIKLYRALLGLARVNGKPFFQMRQSPPLQHHTMVYNMQPNSWFYPIVW